MRQPLFPLVLKPLSGGMIDIMTSRQFLPYPMP